MELAARGRSTFFADSYKEIERGPLQVLWRAGRRQHFEQQSPPRPGHRPLLRRHRRPPDPWVLTPAARTAPTASRKENSYDVAQSWGLWIATGGGNPPPFRDGCALRCPSPFFYKNHSKKITLDFFESYFFILL